MTLEQVDSSVQTWWLEPRDPLVFGDGSRIAALAPRHNSLLPPQGTLSGMVRTRFVAGKGSVTREDARGLLEIRIRGPWLARSRGAGKAPELWLPVPSDVVVADGRLIPGKLLSLAPDEGSLWPAGLPSPPTLVARTDKLAGTKTARPDFPFWPFEEVVRWSLQPGHEAAQRADARRRISPEYRVHVGIADESWTAEPEALFSSAGLRYAPGFGIVVEVADGRASYGKEDPVPGGPAHLLVLGAEARTVACTVLQDPCLPSFDGPVESWRDDGGLITRPASFRDLYRQRIEELWSAGRSIGLRLQLITPGAFGGWQPSWPPELQDKLLAVSLERYVPVSGWDLQAGGPRSVRRLVPAGSVYFLGPFGSREDTGTVENLLDLCSRYWGRSLCEGLLGEERSLQAPPCHDGYGLVLPAPFGLPRS